MESSLLLFVCCYCDVCLFCRASDGYLYIYNRDICDRTLKVCIMYGIIIPTLYMYMYMYKILAQKPSALIPVQGSSSGFFSNHCLYCLTSYWLLCCVCFPHTLFHIPLPPPHNQIDAHQDDADAVAFADESSQIIFSAGDDGLCKVWDRRALSESHPCPVGCLAGHRDGITFIDTKVCAYAKTECEAIQCTGCSLILSVVQHSP